MKRLVVILGPHAVGKMTIGQELAKITDLKLLHNHMTIELVREFFSPHSSEEGRRLNSLFRQEIFKAVAESQLPGLIFTYMYDFDIKSDYDYINDLIKLFKDNQAIAHIIELIADFEVRIERNKTENRLKHKASKRNIDESEKLFRNLEAKFRLNSNENEVPFENYTKINNTNITPDIVARMIKEIIEKKGD
ncbi:MAG: AAA family ATPase [Erysipelotrichales bacterium]|nr:AAA family ATPase [Erysipelotrichales bacterium]